MKILRYLAVCPKEKIVIILGSASSQQASYYPRSTSSPPAGEGRQRLEDREQDFRGAGGGSFGDPRGCRGQDDG